jgi:hypothetical protein
MKRVTIPASPDHADRKKRFALEVAIVLGDEIEAKYEVVAKDFPEDLPDFWVDPDDEKKKEIHWLSNFGLLKPDGTFEARLPKGHRYQVEIPIPSSASGKAAKAAGAGAAEQGKMVYYDGRQVRKLEGKYQQGRFVAELDLGDPPVGQTAG